MSNRVGEDIQLSEGQQLTAKQEAFAVGVVEGKTQWKAYSEAFECQNMKKTTIHVKAYELMKHPLVIARIKELRDIVAESAILTLREHCDDLLALRNRALQMGNIAAAIAAEVARGKAAGVAVDVSELHVTTKSLPASVDDFV